VYGGGSSSKQAERINDAWGGGSRSGIAFVDREETQL
jgi:hypothetical protein